MRLRLCCEIVVAAAATCYAGSPSIPTPPQGAVSYKLKLTTFVVPPYGPAGLLLKVRVDGGPVLRLLLDSGSEFLVLDKKAAARSGHSPAGARDFKLVGAGASPRAARREMAATVEMGGLTLRDCPLIVVEGKLLEGIDGVIPLAMFAGFLVHLDVPGRVMELQPHPAQGMGSVLGFAAVRNDHNLLFVPTRLNGTHEGYLLLDTGSSFNVISNVAARALKRPGGLAPSMTLMGGVGVTDGRVFSTGVSFQFGERLVEMQPVVSVDLGGMARHHGLDVSGVIGYPALAESVLTISYPDSLVRIEPK